MHHENEFQLKKLFFTFALSFATSPIVMYIISSKFMKFKSYIRLLQFCLQDKVLHFQN